MKVDEFIKKYNDAENKTDFISKHVVCKYVPYHEKIADCDGIVKATLERDGMFKINTPAQFMLFSVLVITRYTDIEREDNILYIYEKLDELDLINAIISNIPEREFSSYNIILNMIQDDYIENNRSIISFIETKAKAFELSLDAVLDAIQKNISQDESDTANDE